MAHSGKQQALFLLICFLAAVPLRAEEQTYARFRAALAGFVHASGGTQPHASLFSASDRDPELPFPVRQTLLLGASLISEGGLSMPVARKTLLLDTSTESRLELAEGVARTGALVRNWQATRLLRVIPVTLAYLPAPVERARAVRACLEIEGSAAPTLRTAGAVYSDLLALAVGHPGVDRDTLLQTAISQARSEEASILLKQVRAGILFDPEGAAPEDIVGGVIAAWYRSSGFADAQARLGASPGLVRKGLCGALAGAWFGISHIPSQARIGATPCRLLAEVTAGLHDLARDGILLAVTDGAQDATGAPVPTEAPTQSAHADEPLAPMPSIDALCGDMPTLAAMEGGFTMSENSSSDLTPMPAMDAMDAMPPMPPMPAFSDSSEDKSSARSTAPRPQSRILGVGGMSETPQGMARPLVRRSPSLAGALTSLK